MVAGVGRALGDVVVASCRFAGMWPVRLPCAPRDPSDAKSTGSSAREHMLFVRLERLPIVRFEIGGCAQDNRSGLRFSWEYETNETQVCPHCVVPSQSLNSESRSSVARFDQLSRVALVDPTQISDFSLHEIINWENNSLGLPRITPDGFLAPRSEVVGLPARVQPYDDPHVIVALIIVIELHQIDWTHVLFIKRHKGDDCLFKAISISGSLCMFGVGDQVFDREMCWWTCSSSFESIIRSRIKSLPSSDDCLDTLCGLKPIAEFIICEDSRVLDFLDRGLTTSNIVRQRHFSSLQFKVDFCQRSLCQRSL